MVISNIVPYDVNSFYAVVQQKSSFSRTHVTDSELMDRRAWEVFDYYMHEKSHQQNFLVERVESPKRKALTHKVENIIPLRLYYSY